MSSVREIPPGSGINGRPILDDDRNTRHLAYYRPGRDRWGFTWCGKEVPFEHHCPPDHDNLNAPRQRPVGNCAECAEAYAAKPGPDMKRPRRPQRY